MTSRLRTSFKSRLKYIKTAH